MNDSEKKFETFVSNGLTLAKNHSGAANILAMLFPKANESLNTYIPSDRSNSKTRKTQRRLSEKDFSENYFALNPQLDSWGISEFEAAIKNGPKKAFELLQSRLSQAPEHRRSDIRRVFLALLDSEFSTRSLILNTNWLTTILEESPALIAAKDNEAQFLFAVENEDRLKWLILSGLKELSVSDRAFLLEDAINTAVDITVLTDVVRDILGDLHPEGGTERREDADFGERNERIRNLLVARVRKLAATMEIWTQAKSDHLLWFWWGSNHEDEVTSFIKRALETPTGLVQMLDKTVSLVRSTAGDYERVSHYWKRIVDLDDLAAKAQTSRQSDNIVLREKAERFLSALERARSSSF